MFSPPAPPPTRSEQQGRQASDNRLADAVNILDSILGNQIINEDNLAAQQQIQQQIEQRRQLLQQQGEHRRQQLQLLRQLHQQMHDQEQQPDENEDDLEHFMSSFNEVQPWGLESTMVLPPYWNSKIPYKEELVDRGFRLIAVGDNRNSHIENNRLEVKVWDISFLLRQVWDSLDYNLDVEEVYKYEKKNEANLNDWQGMVEWSKIFPWWKSGSYHLRLLGLKTVHERITSVERHRLSNYMPSGLKILIRDNVPLQNIAKSVPLPVLPYGQTMILSHSFYIPQSNDDNNNNGIMNTTMNYLEGNDMNHSLNELPVTSAKYAAYNVLCTSLFLLTEDGMVIILDIETGKVTGTIDNVAASSSMNSDGFDLSNTRKIHGIDVNVVAGNEVIVTSREGLLRSIMF